MKVAGEGQIDMKVVGEGQIYMSVAGEVRSRCFRIAERGRST